MWQPGWEGNLEKNGYIYLYGWVPLLFTWTCHNTVNGLCCWVAKLCPTLCDPMNCSTPGFPVLHHLPVCSNSCPLSQWCHPAIWSSIAPFSSCLSLSQHQGLLQWVGSSHQIAKVLELQLQHQSFQWIFRTDLMSFRLTGLISLQSQGLSRVFSSTIIWKHQFFSGSNNNKKAKTRHLIPTES